MCGPRFDASPHPPVAIVTPFGCSTFRSAFAEASANGGDGNTKLLGQLSVRGASFAAVTQLGECLRFSQTSFAARPTELDAYVDLKRRLVCEVPVGADFGS